MNKIFIILLSAIFFVSISSVQANSYVLPVSGNFRVTQGPGGSYTHSKSATIESWDLAGSGVPVSVDDGKVLKIGYGARGYGNYVTIQHSDGLVSLYAHLAYTSVSSGQTVSQGQQIGVIDSTGKSTGNHLHFTFFKNGKPYSTEDLIDFSDLKGGFIVGSFDKIFPKVGGAAPEPLKPIDLQPIADMVTKFYNWALDIGATAALGIIIYGGVLYISSAGDSSRQTKAKEWVKAAIYGLVLLLACYLILYTINPSLVGAG